MAFFRNPWFLGALAMLALGLFVWFVGPLIAIAGFAPLGGFWTRIIVISLAVLTWIGIRLFRVWQAKKAAAEISSGLVEADDPGAADAAKSEEEVEALRHQFEEAMAMMQKSGGKQSSLYDMPWYMIIGPPGAGKTTALVNSGLRFPLSDRFGKTALRGVGGTRNCDWWFTDDAILLDTAGRYTTQDSHASVDKAAWEGFLGLLQKYRKRRPINGVLVAISAQDFLTMPPAQRREHAASIKDRIQELDEFFGMRFPVYLIVTKCDLINGFVDYFDDLSAEERQQVWGVTLPFSEEYDSEGVTGRLGRELDALFARLGERLLSRLHNERDVKRRGNIYSFPQQVYSLKDTVVEFVDDVFRSSRFEQSALLRGVYFSSGTQEGTPIDRVMGSIARTFGLEQQALPSFSGQGRSYFLTNLMRFVVFQESGIAGTNEKAEKRRAWLQRLAYGGVFVLVGLLVAGWIGSYFGNQALMADVGERTVSAEQRLGEISQARHEPEVTLEALNELRTLAGEQEGYFSGLGLDQGDKLQQQAQAAYRRALVNQLLPRVMLRLEQQIEQTDRPLDYTYEALKNYLRLGSDKRYDATEIAAWVGFDWETRLPREIGNERYEQLRTHLLALLEERPQELPLPLDVEVIEQARLRLMRVSLEERIYTRLKGSRVTEGLDDFTILNRAGPEAMRVFTRDSGQPLSEGVPAFFTRAGYDRIFKDVDSARLVQQLAAEQWVLKDDVNLASSAVDISEMLVSLRELYFDEYVRQYNDLIYDIRLAPFKNAREASSILNVLARPGDSPLTNLISAIQAETDFSEPEPAEAAEGAAGAVAERQNELENRFSRNLSNRARGLDRTGYIRQYLNVVEEQFAEFRELAGPGERGGTLNHLVDLLRELADFMMLVASEETADGVPQDIVRQGQSILQRARFTAQSTKLPFVKDLLTQAATSVDNIASGGVATNIEAQWRAGPMTFCNRAIADRYPIDRGARAEIRLEDFGRFFGYGGVAEQFFDGYLQDKIDTTSRPWRAQETRGVRIADDAIRMFERAQAVKETFFRGDAKPYVGFQLTPISMDPQVTQYSLTVDGQSVQYFHGPRVAKSFDWPGASGVGEVRMEMAPNEGNGMRIENGPWAWFKVLDDSTIRPGSGPEQYQVVFSLGGRTATYELIARSAYNPFDLPELSEFRCPQRLTR